MADRTRQRHPWMEGAAASALLLALALAAAACSDTTGGPGAQDIASPGTDVVFPSEDAPTPPDGGGSADTSAASDPGTTPDPGATTDPGAAADPGQTTGDATAASDPGPAQDTGSVLPMCGAEDIDFPVALVPPRILLVLDRSGSMYGTKWNGTKAAVTAVLGDKGAAMAFGLLFMPADKGCSLSDAPEVPFGLGQADAIVAAMDTAGTGGSTPMGQAMRRAVQIFQADPPPGDAYVILAADGKPSDLCLAECSTCDCLYMDTCEICADLLACTDREVEGPVEELAALGIKTFVIGFEGAFGATELLNSLATKGNTALATEPKFYQAGDGSALADALGDITTLVPTCKVTLEPPAGYDYLAVQIDGEVVLRDTDHVDGWDLLEGDVLQFYGPRCAQAVAPEADVVVTYICKK